jgi:hypothetical protein
MFSGQFQTLARKQIMVARYTLSFAKGKEADADEALCWSTT